MRDPERPYAQLLTPAAKSQKLLLRLRHQKLLPTADLLRSQAIFSLWQKLLAKNIPSTPWPSFADLLLYPDDQYLALRFWPFGDLSPLEQAYRARYIDGYVLVDGREEAPPVALEGQKLVVALSLADRIGRRLWQWLGGQLSPWQSQTAAALPPLDADGALDLMGLLRQYGQAPWPENAAGAPPEAQLAKGFFILWRARSNAVSISRLAEQGVEEVVAWLAVNSDIVVKAEKGYAIRS